ncbi:MAG: threonine ammonia-lyase [SAR324 cluster bacterium]|nr:threonine ammonia-lyase [SAR324 cluster bacterium]
MLSLKDVRQAEQRIRPYILKSPCTYSQKLSMATCCELFLKLENFQMTGAYKQRGAFNKILKLTEQERQAGVITSSAGNHAQGVAYAAERSGIHATIVMPETTPLAKIQGTKKFNPDIVLHGNSYDEAYLKARELCEANGYTFIHPFNDPDVIAGQGTVGLELIEQCPDMETIIVPIGGGGLIAGVAVAIKEWNPKVQIIGVEAQVIPAMQKSLEAGQIVDVPYAKTIADGIAVSRVGTNTFPLVQKYVDDIVTVSEEEIANAIVLLLEQEKTLAEGAGAVGMAAVYHHKIPRMNNRKTIVLISGGNIDSNTLSTILERGLAKAGRLASFHVLVPDRPGILAELSRVIASRRANILQISHNRSYSKTSLGEAEVEFTIETRGHEHIAEVVQDLEKDGFIVHLK